MPRPRSTRSPSAGGGPAPPSWWGATDPRCQHQAFLGRPGLEQSKGVTSSANQIGQLPGRPAVSAADMKRAVTRSPERQQSRGRRVFTWFSYKEALKCRERRPWKEHASHSSCLLLKYRVAGLQPCSEGYFRSWLLCCRGRCQRSPGLDGLTLGFWRWEEGVPQALRQGWAFPVERGSRVGRQLRETHCYLLVGLMCGRVHWGRKGGHRRGVRGGGHRSAFVATVSKRWNNPSPSTQ